MAGGSSQDGAHPVTRRDLFRGAAGALLAAALPSPTVSPRPAASRPFTADGSCWRGFNLHTMFSYKYNSEFEEHDFRWMAEWGFNFVRIPVAYQTITIERDPRRPDEWWLRNVDRALDYAHTYGLHVCLNLNRVPGHPSYDEVPQPPKSLWKDPDSLQGFRLLWGGLAARYKEVPPSQLSFNLVNEPPPVGEEMSVEDHLRVIRAAADAVRAADPDRPLNTDGTTMALVPRPELAILGLGQSLHAYVPFEISHYGASWISDSPKYTTPIWPGVESRGFYHSYPAGFIWNRAKLEEFFRPWFELAKSGVPVFCGETGAYNKTPHAIALAWLRDVLDMLTRHKIGWALWNFRGDFGILDSGRADVDYEDFHGHRLDRKLLSLLQEFC